MKKLLALVLAALMVLGAVSAFADEAPAKNIPELTTEPMTILLWDIATSDPGKSTQEDAVARFMADYPNIKVEQIHKLNDNYKQDLQVGFSAKEGQPDMYIHWGGGPMAEYYKSGCVNDITELWNTYDHPDFIDAAVAQSTFDGKILAVPFGGLSGCDIFYNKDIFAELNLEIPTTIAELEAACETIKAAGYYPFALANLPRWTGSMYYMYLVARHSGNAEFDAAYDGTGSFTSPAFIYAGEKIQDWVQKGYFNDGFNSMAPDNNDDRAMLIQGVAAMMLHGSWQVSGVKADDPEFYESSFGTFRFPIDEEAQAAGVPQNVEIGTAIGNGFSFNCWLDAEHTQVDEEKLKACYVLATQYYNDDIYNAKQVEAGGTPSIKGFDVTDDPNLKVVIDTFFNASNVQLWYDQYLPASVTEVHKDMMGELFGLSKTPQEVGEAQDAAMAAARAE